MKELPTIIIDTREKLPLSFKCLHIRGVKELPTITRKLDVGDYSIAGFEDQVFIERKSVNDLYGTLFSGRERFERELERAKDHKYKYLLVESTDYLFIKYMMDHDRTNMINAAEVSLRKWERHDVIHTEMKGTREMSAEFIARLALKLALEQEQESD